METKLKKKLPYWDNLKGFLIFIVVFGHILEAIPHVSSTFIYKYLYVFNMPLFVFVSGYLGSFKPKAIIQRVAFPYVLMQTIVCLVYSYPIQYLFPKKAMWYLISLICWRLMIPFLDLVKKNQRPLILLMSIAIALAAGYYEDIGFMLTISRTIVFAPYFILGYYLRKYFKENESVYNKLSEDNKKNKFMKLCFIIIGAITTLVLYKLAPIYIKAKYLYGSQWYENEDLAVITRFLHYGVVILLGVGILSLISNSKTIFTYFGEDSLQILVLHPFLSNYIKYHSIFVGMPKPRAIIISFVLAFVFCLFILLLMTVYRNISDELKNYIKSKKAKESKEN